LNLHIVTKVGAVRDAVAVVTYDKQMVHAADHLGLPVVSPGVPVGG
jgi:hypothetical protein